MRNAACDSLARLYPRQPFLFFTGDLGFRALEPLREVMGERFINAGVAEQNMISVAAGASLAGLDSWVYSIAPFCYARPFEQIRNDVCLHDVALKLIGNGGGYAYGVMGASHHAIEDYGALLTLQHMHAFVPAFDEDVDPLVRKLAGFPHPAYLRLGRCEKPDGLELPPYAPWRRLVSGEGVLVIVVGPLVGGLVAALRGIGPEERPEVWVLSELPIESNAMPAPLLASLQRLRRVLVVEEHVAHGSAGAMLSRAFLSRGLALEAFEHACARGYESGTYGSQGFHRAENGLDAQSLMGRIRGLRA